MRHYWIIKIVLSWCRGDGCRMVFFKSGRVITWVLGRWTGRRAASWNDFNLVVIIFSLLSSVLVCGVYKCTLSRAAVPSSALAFLVSQLQLHVECRFDTHTCWRKHAEVWSLYLFENWYTVPKLAECLTGMTCRRLGNANVTDTWEMAIQWWFMS